MAAQKWHLGWEALRDEKRRPLLRRVRQKFCLLIVHEEPRQASQRREAVRLSLLRQGVCAEATYGEAHAQGAQSAVIERFCFQSRTPLGPPDIFFFVIFRICFCGFLQNDMYKV
jgi:hypothetical protein